MNKYILIFLFIPFASCAKSEPTVTDLAYSFDVEMMGTTTVFSHQEWDALLQKHVSNSGKVNYEGFRNDMAALQSYLDILAENIPKKTSSKNATLAYWINTYNAFTVKLILDNYPINSIKDIKKPWDEKFIILENRVYSLGEIEHKILRQMNEPRIHFAINCASYSCPNLLNEAFTESKMEKQLEDAAISFINDETKNYLSKNKIELSKIFKWFSADFKNEGTLIDFINNYSKVPLNAKAKIKYKNYNWSLNG